HAFPHQVPFKTGRYFHDHVGGTVFYIRQGFLIRCSGIYIAKIPRGADFCYQLLGKAAVVIVYNGNIDMLYIKIHGQRNNDELKGGHHKHHSQYAPVPEYLQKFFLKYIFQHPHANLFLKFLSAMAKRSTVMPTSTSVSFHTYSKPSPFSITDFTIKKYQREGMILEMARNIQGIFSSGNMNTVKISIEDRKS